MSPLVLSDGWPDGGPDERVWVECAAAPAGGAQALEVALAYLDGYADALEDDGLELAVTGRREWMREAPCQACDGSGSDPSWRFRSGATLGGAEDLPGPDPACESCGGDGRQTGEEGYAYHRLCDAGDAGALEFWVLEVRERSTA